MKPFWPLAFPWHPPLLQPCLVKSGTIELWKFTGFSLETAFTSNGMEAVSPVGLRAVITPEPLAKDSTKPSVIRTKPAGSAVRATSLVWSATEPSPSVCMTSSCCRASAPLSVTRFMLAPPQSGLDIASSTCADWATNSPTPNTPDKHARFLKDAAKSTTIGLRKHRPIRRRCKRKNDFFAHPLGQTEAQCVMWSRFVSEPVYRRGWRGRLAEID